MAFKSRTRLRRLLEGVVAEVPHILVQRNPYFPDLLNQPAVLVIPELGRMIAIYLYTPRQRLTWRSVLPAIEDLFELKLATGEHTVAIAVIETSPEILPVDRNIIEILAGMFDGFISLEGEENPGPDRLVARLKQILRDATPKQQLLRLWHLERVRIAKELQRFSEERYGDFVNERANAVQMRTKLLSSLTAVAEQRPIQGLMRNFRVPTPKEFIAGLPERNQFVFNFAIISDPPDRPITAIDVVTLGRYGSRSTIRYLMSKARFVSYDLQMFDLAYRTRPIRPVLLVDGNLAGPHHDPYRYVRALVSAGWEIARAETDALLKLANANV